MSTIADVAKAAGVSRSTVSYALSGRRPISVETRRRIQAAMEALQFTPHASARALRTAKTAVLGLMLRFHEDEFAPAMLQYVLPIADTARSLGYDVLMMTEADGPAALARVTRSGMVDGLILLDVVHEDPRVDALRVAKQPGVLIGLPDRPAGLDVVELDFEAAGAAAVGHLHELGHQRICLITPPRHVFDRGGGYSWRFRDAAVRTAADLGLQMSVRFGAARQPAVDKSLRGILASHADATAVIVHNDASVAALPNVLRDLGTRVPEDLSVLSVYSREFANWFSLPYTSIDSAPEVIGRLAVNVLARRIQGEPRPPDLEATLIRPQVIDRRSTSEPVR